MKNPKHNELFNKISSASNNLNRKLDRHLGAVHGIGITEFRVLSILATAPTLTLSRIELADALGLTASGVTRLLSPMVKIGLVEKQANARDARVSLVKLSKSGKVRYEESIEGFDYVLEASLKGLNANGRKELMSLLDALL